MTSFNPILNGAKISPLALFVINPFKTKPFTSNHFDFESNLFTNNLGKLEVVKVAKFPGFEVYQNTFWPTFNLKTSLDVFVT